MARFCRVLGTLLRNGVPILKSLEISRDATGNRVLSQAIARGGGEHHVRRIAWPSRWPPAGIFRPAWWR